MITTVAIDPGSSSGALAWLDDGGLRTCNMPSTFKDIWDAFHDPARASARFYIEDVGGSRPGNAAKSARTFAEHCGALKMAAVASGHSHELVAPRRWLTGLFGDAYPKGPTPADVKARKHFIYERMQREYPTATFTLRQADAVAILHWAVTKGGPK